MVDVQRGMGREQTGACDPESRLPDGVAVAKPGQRRERHGGFSDQTGFDVTPASDLTQVDMRAFAAKVARARSDTVALVYYAGHGVQIAGENFLVPVRRKITRLILRQNCFKRSGAVDHDGDVPCDHFLAAIE